MRLEAGTRKRVCVVSVRSLKLSAGSQRKLSVLTAGRSVPLSARQHTQRPVLSWFCPGSQPPLLRLSPDRLSPDSPQPTCCWCSALMLELVSLQAVRSQTPPPPPPPAPPAPPAPCTLTTACYHLTRTLYRTGPGLSSWIITLLEDKHLLISLKAPTAAYLRLKAVCTLLNLR